MNSEEYMVVAAVFCFLQYYSLGVWFTRWRILVIVPPVTREIL